ncbi:MAG: hypothetical protein IJE28_07895, partial [Oscillospiraceae bacterium]|nr:hypothetical protein [Oscillospiraceae bacterium]
FPSNPEGSLPCAKGGGISERNDGGIVIPSIQIQPHFLRNGQDRSLRWCGNVILSEAKNPHPQNQFSTINYQLLIDNPSSAIFDGPPPPRGYYNSAGNL